MKTAFITLKPKTLFLDFLLLFLFAATGKSQYTDLLDFNGTNGKNPVGALTSSGTVLYGVTENGGANGGGIIFSFNTTSNVSTDLFDLIYANGISPFRGSSVILSGNTLYGMTNGGGANGDGVIYSFNVVSNLYTDLLDFNSTNGQYPYGTVALSGTTLYGMTDGGGANSDGVIFSYDIVGNVYTDLLDFNGTNGSNPEGSLVLSGNTLYGMASSGGANNVGLVFSFNTVGNVYTDLLDFNGTNGSTPYGTLILSGTTLYGMTYVGGANGLGVVFSYNTAGDVYTDLLDFNGTNGGGTLSGQLVLSGSTLYGMTGTGGANNDGVVFSLNTVGNVYTDLFDFNGTNGANPKCSLTLSGDTLYGVAYKGGANGDGVLFSLVDNSLGIKNIENVSGINLYPNPNNGIFTIQSSVVSGQSSIEIYNALGQQVYSAPTLLPQSGGGVSFSCKIDLSAEPNGVYLYRIIANNEGLIGEGKVIIQK